MMMNHNKERRDFSERQENLKRSIFSHEEDEYKNENVKKPKIASSGMHDSMHMDDQLYSKHMKGFRNYDIHKDVCEISADSRIYTKTVDVHSFLEEEPWYMTSEFSLVDVSCIDAVLISNPQGMLGLPFLTGMKGFSGKVCFMIFSHEILLCFGMKDFWKKEYESYMIFSAKLLLLFYYEMNI